MMFFHQFVTERTHDFLGCHAHQLDSLILISQPWHTSSSPSALSFNNLHQQELLHICVAKALTCGADVAPMISKADLPNQKGMACVMSAFACSACELVVFLYM
jgi:hypothetical protein